MKNIFILISVLISACLSAQENKSAPAKQAIIPKEITPKTEEEKAREKATEEKRAKQAEGKAKSKAEDEAAMKASYEKARQKDLKEKEV